MKGEAFFNRTEGFVVMQLLCKLWYKNNQKQILSLKFNKIKI